MVSRGVEMAVKREIEGSFTLLKKEKYGEVIGKLNKVLEECADKGIISKDYYLSSYVSRNELDKDTDWEDER